MSISASNPCSAERRSRWIELPRTAAPLHILSRDNKTYAGTTTAQLSNVVLNPGNIVSGDDLGVTGGTGRRRQPRVQDA
ncbi:hypothetical protein PSAC2689_200078 [Paraburkholderia sacchari]